MKEKRRTYEFPKDKVGHLLEALSAKGYIFSAQHEGTYIFDTRRKNHIGIINEGTVETISPEQDRIIGRKICHILSELKLE